ncbi:MAG: hypothetical protein EXR08_11915 [Alphaproteobacteria bacterium]|nr:hypothetical protein [Alphaproteobacteria bacterium]
MKHVQNSHRYFGLSLNWHYSWCIFYDTFSTGIGFIVAAGTLNSPAAIVFMQELLKLMGLLAWPITMIIIYLLSQKQVHDILEALAARVKDPNSNIKAGLSGFELTRPEYPMNKSPSDARQKLINKHESDIEFPGRLAGWLAEVNPGLTPTALLDGAGHEELCKRAVEYFSL